MSIKVMSWNVNGIRAAEKKGFIQWLKQESPDVIGLQEIKALPEQLSDELLHIEGYEAHWNPAERKGYSGTVVYTKIKPLSVKTGLLDERFNHEGRTLIVEYDDWVFFNIYYPNGKQSPERLQYKMDFYDDFLRTVDQYKAAGKNVVCTGDFNTAHETIDLAHPKQNEKESGFLPEERAWIDKYISHGYVDTFREFHPEPHQYTWWSNRANARANNVGWRIDYFFVNEEFMPRVKDSFIMPEVMGSDHCPVGIIID